MNEGSFAGIIGGVVAGLLLLGILIFCCYRRKSKKGKYAEGAPGEVEFYDRDAPESGEQYQDDKPNSELKHHKQYEANIVPQNNYSEGQAGGNVTSIVAVVIGLTISEIVTVAVVNTLMINVTTVAVMIALSDQRDRHNGSRDRLDDRRDRYGGSRDRLDDQRDRYGSSDRLDDQRDRYGSRDRLDDQRDRYGSRDRLDDQRNRYGSRDRLDDRHDRYGGSRDRLDYSDVQRNRYE
ncbi:cell surface A33 antigen [Lates japonicus]|uniref:Cell surface A33 antigen n=1 Tax=Lates japonicus TaxID=270547 RepID=A0AAD3MDJ0_LATJO|nr:cell surface A33 antigen [Lates japonicus]